MIEQLSQIVSADDASGDEFIIMLAIMQKLPHLQTLQGRKELMQLVLSKIKLDKPFEVGRLLFDCTLRECAIARVYSRLIPRAWIK